MKLFPLKPLPVNLQKIIIIVSTVPSSSSSSSYRHDHRHHRPVNVQQIWFHYPKKVQPCVTPSTSASFLQLSRSDFLLTKNCSNQSINQSIKPVLIVGGPVSEALVSGRINWKLPSPVGTRGAASHYYLDNLDYLDYLDYHVELQVFIILIITWSCKSLSFS